MKRGQSLNQLGTDEDQHGKDDSKEFNPSLLGSIYQALSERRIAYDTLMWQVPALGLSGQAFLFTIALGPGSSKVARLASAFLAFILAIISMQLMSKHRYHEELNSRLLEQFEIQYHLNEILGYPFHSPSKVRAVIRVRAGWFTRRSSYWIWTLGLSLFALVSLAIIGVIVTTFVYPTLLPAAWAS